MALAAEAAAGPSSESNLTLFWALPPRCDRRFDFCLTDEAAAAAPELFVGRFSLAELATWLRSAFNYYCSWFSAVGMFGGMFDSGNATQAYSANQSAPLGGLNRIYFGNVIAVYAMSDV